MNFSESLHASALQININLSTEQIEAFDTYRKLLEEWNKSINLTRITEEKIIPLHFIDSLLTARLLPVESNLRMIDVGTGAGFPGLPLKIVFPELEVTLLDSSEKKVHFLKHVIARLSLTNISAIHGRAEELAHQTEYREQYDIATARAVANLRSLSEILLPFVKKGGQMIALKSHQVDTELETASEIIQIIGGSFKEIKSINIPTTDINRSFIVVDKKTETPAGYPRSSKKIFV